MSDANLHICVQPAAEATIAAIATPPGPGGIGIIRISGSRALPILTALFTPKCNTRQLRSHRLYYGWIKNPLSGQPIDEVMAVFMRAPKTYTREDIVEIQCHGSYLVLQDILGQIITLGATLAEPGEFTKRAFLNGRIDLTQAEAVIELLQAKTREGLGLAMSQLQGHLGLIVNSIRAALMSLRAVIEVAIDFPDDDVEIINAEEMGAKLERDIISPLRGLIKSAGQGKIFRDGISVIILGRPNVGKSSLLNALLREERAIVTPIPGTTRDTIEELLDMKGMPVRIIDTAGIRDDAEEVEEIGILRARKKLAEADLVLLMVDGTQPPAPADTILYESVGDKKILLVVNKSDLDGHSLSLFEAAFPGVPKVAVSAKTHEGIADLENGLFALVTGGSSWDPGYSCVPNVRQKASLEKALTAARGVEQGLRADLPPDLLAIELQSALDHLADITGETTTEDILDLIFDQFCIGK
ncbi:MAG: tRNA uridine-5-carboxymethylaminomethyl(34) synthesis GTPase MnmE [Deltaproteobacteria bacterium]|nr:tRNA uridine-5-carboxymethylaminomethyl(34) synthesis GTPase MnmE [Deltaproteobacteria bacterium]